MGTGGPGMELKREEDSWEPIFSKLSALPELAPLDPGDFHTLKQ